MQVDDWNRDATFALKQNNIGARDRLQPGQVARLIVMTPETGAAEVIHVTERLIEAPNWTPDGKWLIVNADGKLYRIAADGSTVLTEIPTGDVQDCNNDHVLSPDGQRIYLSAGGHIYVTSITGGAPARVSNLHPDEAPMMYFLHGVSPDEATLAYVAVRPKDGDPWALRGIATIPTAGGADTHLTDGTEYADGPEYTPDGAWIWLNWERNGRCPGHAQIFRMRPDGSDIQQMTADDRVNWFPHISPDGQQVVFVSFPQGIEGHPADVPVTLRIMPAAGGTPRDLIDLFGGQGTINVNSWSPDSRRFAYVDYPVL